RQPLDRIDVRLLHLLQELARVGRERFDVAALAFGINRVEGERGLARARKPGDNDQAIAWNLKVDILEIVLARALDDYPIRHRRQTFREIPVRLAGTASSAPRRRAGRAAPRARHRPMHATRIPWPPACSRRSPRRIPLYHTRCRDRARCV